MKQLLQIDKDSLLIETFWLSLIGAAVVTERGNPLYYKSEQSVKKDSDLLQIGTAITSRYTTQTLFLENIRIILVIKSFQNT